MPIIKPRKMPLDLKIMSFLNVRMKFNEDEKYQFQSMKKGYEGEVQFDLFYKDCPDSWLVLNDLWLKNNNSNFQIDSLLISPKTIYIFDVKNFQYEYYLQDDRWYYINGKELKSNPLTQLERCETSFRYCMKQLGFSYPIVSNVVFVNPEFTLYDAPRNLPILLPSQNRQFFKSIKKNDWNINKPTQSQLKLASHISSIHLDKSPYSNLPEYDFGNLQKGIVCTCCQAFLPPPVKEKRTVVCHNCGQEESVRNCILRSIEKFQLLFPNEKITVDKIYEWCKVIECKRKVRRVLIQHFNHFGHGKNLHYTDLILSNGGV